MDGSLVLAVVGAITAIATTALAVVGALTFRQNRSVTKATLRLADASEKQAEAAERQAQVANEALAAARRGEELASRPQLVVDRGEESQTAPTYRIYVLNVRNVGPGAALRVRLAAHEFVENHWFWSSDDAFGLGPGEARRFAPVNLTAIPASQRYRSVVDDLATGDPSLIWAAVYEDAMGNRYRSSLARGFESWRPESGTEAPDWARY